MARPAEERFLEKIQEMPSGCIEFTGYRTKDGYGSFWTGERYPGPSRSPVMDLAHRWAYKHFVGAIPDGHNVCHSCDNPPCVHLMHLFAGTQRTNVHDCIVKGRHRNGRRSLSDEQAAQLRGEYVGAYGDVRRLAKKYEVTTQVVHGIVRNLPRRFGRALQ